MTWLQELFTPIARLFRHMEELRSQAQACFEQPDAAVEVVSAESPRVPGVPPTHDGDVTDAIAAQCTAKAKVELVAKPNKDSEDQRKESLRAHINKQAATIMRNRVICMKTAEEVKTFMESCQRGLVARTVVIDVTMPASRQAGKRGRSISLAPTSGDQKGWASQVKVLPATPVVGHILVRTAQHSIETLNNELSATHAHKRSITVPVRVPEEFLRYLRGAATRSHGPRDDESTGVDFVMRTIGKRTESTKSPNVPADDSQDREGEACAEAAEEEEEATQSGEEWDDGDNEDVQNPTEVDKTFGRLVGLSLMNATQLRAIFGVRADDVSGILFQHSARITGAADFLKKPDAFLYRASERAVAKRYRRGQMDTSVYIRALQSALSSSNVALSQNEVLVILTGGTPEALVAGIVCGYKRVFVVTEGLEYDMMQLPSHDVEGQVDYDQCP